VVLLIFILMFGVCFGAFWFVVKPSGAEKKTEKRLRAVTKPALSGLDSRLSLDGILRAANDDGAPWYQRNKLWRWFAALLEESDAHQSPKQVLMWSLAGGGVATFVGMMFLPAPLFTVALAFLGMYAPIIRLGILRKYSAADSLPLAIWERISWRKISAPPPVKESSPASFNRLRVSRTGLRASQARWRISIAVKHLSCNRGSTAFNARNISV
jgi:hypothetical protein